MDPVGLGIAIVWGGLILLVVVLSILWIIALVDCLLRPFRDPMVKLIWVLVIIFTHGLGAILYYLFGRSQASPR